MRVLGEKELNFHFGGDNCSHCIEYSFKISNSFTTSLCKGYYQYWEADCETTGPTENCPRGWNDNLIYCKEFFRLYSIPTATYTTWSYCQESGVDWTCTGGSVIYTGYGTYFCFD